MDVKEILKHVDHTLLTQTATWAEIRQICDDAVKYGTASVCIPACICETGKRVCAGSDGSVHGHRLSEWLYDHRNERV